MTSGPDNQWYDSWAYSTHCPPLTKSTTVTGTSDPDGDVHLTWNDYGRDMWYWLESRDATAGTAWKRGDYWMTGPAFDTNPITSTAVNGHTFQYRVVPYANGFGGREAPTSNVLSIVARVALPVRAGRGHSRRRRARRTAMPPSRGRRSPTRTLTTSTGSSTGSHRRTDRGRGASATAWFGETATWTTLTLKKGHAYGFDVQAQNIAGNGARSTNVFATP